MTEPEKEKKIDQQKKEEKTKSHKETKPRQLQ
jgi:hypothetical protein